MEFPAYHTINILNSPWKVNNLRGAVFLGVFGYRLYAYVNDDDQKKPIVDYISSEGIVC